MNSAPASERVLLSLLANGDVPHLKNLIIVFDEGRCPAWIGELHAMLEGIPGLQIGLYHREASGSWNSAAGGWLPDRLTRYSLDAFDPSSPGSTQCPPSLPWTQFADVKPDLILWLSLTAQPDEGLTRNARWGAVTVEAGEPDSPVPFWAEAASGSPTTSTRLIWFERDARRGRAVRTAETETWQGLAFTCNARFPLKAAARMLARFCFEFAYGGDGAAERYRQLPEAKSVGAARPKRSLSNWAAAKFVAQKLGRSALKRFDARGRRPCWFVALRPNRGGTLTDLGRPHREGEAGFTEIPLYPGSQEMADPFLWEHEGTQYLLFEDMPARGIPGRIGCSRLDSAGRPVETKIVLTSPTHMSYPCVIPAQGELFLLPETADAWRIELYRFRRFPWELELVATPLENLMLVDTTPVFLDGVWYLFTTTTEPFMETLLFVADRLEGPWRQHPCGPISGSVVSSRSAGNLYFEGGRLFRPVQDCSVRYGYAMTVNEVIRLTPTEFEERPAGHVPPVWMPGLLGTHTWNQTQAFQVIDGLRFR